MSIDNVGIVSAFDEIESERDFYKKKREQDNEMMMSKKSSLAKTIAFIPFGIVVGGYMILPFLQMVLSMVNTMNSAMTTM
jgi:hypothetical protein